MSQDQNIQRVRAEALFKKEEQMREGANAMAERRNKRPGRRQLGFVRYEVREMLLKRPELQA